ncbi:MAG: hypothetical protein A2204_06620 [Elusimicrobia bacterium RIFOXYA1_FULL_47_7]|nr:MAG: hypothetical protein A2278_01870 [Elusimicrobia bacterium RIFOXYA12_FULL_49_49]OGS09696.1 MAG: hypothetical protein A2204_06620 [Elusimicrobia bacterium RIFOXYA1_FULL_47_7]OGS10307.1 MAG: hypothetical protein A2386_00605 [Elusimicrobia bacterium RIFOXYB1_FULL_48_9]OGS16795.1 MAG: hypothetical protein A2251_05320 [Elusimicrobia bacterium RIFOXYA2_FULL_47_53]OGS32023.1 MAG: hypothetical protein A2323_08095 [Elusimicrobia bacterium RIFOXYB2_FULL_46_23]
MNIINKLKDKTIILLAALYTAGFGISLLNKGLYWDDWVFYNARPMVFIESSRQMGTMWFGYLHALLHSLTDGVWAFRLTVFLSFFAAAMFLNSLLKSIKEIDDNSRLFITLFFALFPVNSSRLIQSVAQYSVSYMLFFLGLWLLMKYLSEKKVILRVFSLAAFMLSFATSSLLVFYLLVPIYIVYSLGYKITSPNDFIKSCVKYLDFLAAPIIFWIIKTAYFKPFGNYTGYNELGNVKPLMIMQFMTSSFSRSFLDIINLSTKSVSLIGILLIAVIYFTVRKDSSSKLSFKMNLLFIGLGLIAFMAAVFPYNAVGLIPLNDDWQGRHQLLVPLGSALMLYGTISLFFSRLTIVRDILFVSFAVLFMSANFNYQMAFLKDWYKQSSLRVNIMNLSQAPQLKNAHTFVVRDNTQGMNVNNRSYRFYEFSGIFKAVYGDESRFASEQSRFNAEITNTASESERKHFGLADYAVSSGAESIITIDHGLVDTIFVRPMALKDTVLNYLFRLGLVKSGPEYPALHNISNLRALKMLLHEYTDKTLFAEELRKLTKVKCESL